MKFHVTRRVSTTTIYYAFYLFRLNGHDNSRLLIYWRKTFLLGYSMPIEAGSVQNVERLTYRDDDTSDPQIRRKKFFIALRAAWVDRNDGSIAQLERERLFPITLSRHRFYPKSNVLVHVETFTLLLKIIKINISRGEYPKENTIRCRRHRMLFWVLILYRIFQNKVQAQRIKKAPWCMFS